MPTIYQTIAAGRVSIANSEIQLVQRLMEAYGQAWRHIEQRLAEVERRMLEAIQNGEPITEHWLQRQAWWDSTLRSIEAELQRLTSQMANEIAAGQMTIVNVAMRSTDAITEYLQQQAAKQGLSISALFPGRVDTGAFERWVIAALEGSPVRAAIDRYGDRVSESIRQRMTDGMAAGLHPRQIVRSIVSDVGPNAIEGRLHTIARTEVHRAYRGSLADNLKPMEDSGAIVGWRWLASLSPRTCPACLAMHGKVFKHYPMKFHVACFPAGTVVNGPSVRAATKRWYEGELIEIITATNQRLSVTPNHPILTSKGWVAAGLLDEGHDVICYIDPQGPSSAINPNYQDQPTLIENVAESLVNSGQGVSSHVPGTAENFHGDGTDGEVNVVLAHGLLRDGAESTVNQPTLNQQFFRGDVGLPFFPRSGALLSLLNCLDSSLGSLVSGFQELQALLFGRLGHSQVHSFRSPTQCDARFDEMPTDDPSGGSEFRGNRFYGLPFEIPANQISEWDYDFFVGGHESSSSDDGGNSGGSGSETSRNRPDRLPVGVTPDHIITVNRSWFSGHVYNLETTDGWYISNNIIVHNCRCSAVPLADPKLIPQRAPGMTGEQWLRNQPEEVQRRVLMTKGRYDAFSSGDYTLDDFTGTKHSKIWGESVRVKPMREVRSR